MSEPSAESDGAEVEDDGAGRGGAGPEGGLSEQDYALGDTSDPDGAESEEPAGEDYAGSGF